MKKNYIIQIMICIVAALLPAYVSANSIEGYNFEDVFFTGTYVPQLYVHADVNFNRGGNNFGGKMFFQDVKMIPLMQLGLSGNTEKNCYKQLRGFYINTARGNRVWPLDEDSLAHLQSVVPSFYNFMTITGGLFVCDYPSNGLVGYLQHIWKGEEYSLVAGTEYDFTHNDYLPSFDSNGSFTFENTQTYGYLRDSYGGIAYVQGSGLDIQYACGNDIVEGDEQCDDGLQNGTVGNCNESCNGTTFSICGDGIVQSSYEACDSGSGNNGSAGYCNLACTSMIPVVVPPPSGGGGGGGSVVVKDSCPDNRDCSNSYYDSICGPCTLVEKIVQKLPLHTSPADLPLPSVADSSYSQELNDAYLWAYAAGITTMPTIQRANMTGTLLRKHAAKMISQFATNVLGKIPNTGAICVFTDVRQESQEMQFYVKNSCQLGLMGLKSNGTPDTKFNPNGEVTRAQFGTMLSRLLYGNLYNGQAGERYYAHLHALNVLGIMTKISQPAMLELRGYVMLMMMRSVK